jgi:hypothetical protein
MSLLTFKKVHLWDLSSLRNNKQHYQEGLFVLDIPTLDERVVREATLEVTPEVTPDVIRMVSIISGEMTRGEIQEKPGLRDEKHFRENYQQIAVKLGIIEMTIPDKPCSSKQKYRLTDKGEKWLKEGKSQQE